MANDPFIVYVILGTLVGTALFILLILKGWIIKRRFHRRMIRAIRAGYLVAWAAPGVEEEIQLASGAPSIKGGWKPSYDEIYVSKGQKLVELTASMNPFTISWTVGYPSAKTILVTYPPPKTPSIISKILDPHTGASRTEVIPPKLVPLGMGPNSVTRGVFILMPSQTTPNERVPVPDSSFGLLSEDFSGRPPKGYRPQAQIVKPASEMD